MAKKEMMKKTIMLVLAAILLASFVLAGVTAPRPRNIQLAPGESSLFSFQIQADDFDIVCKYIPENPGILEITLDDEYQIAAGESLTIKGTVTLPDQATSGNYEATFCIECSPKTTEGGSAVKLRYCKLPVIIEAVSERTRTNQYDKQGISLLWLILLIVIILLILLIWYIIKKKRQK